MTKLKEQSDFVARTSTAVSPTLLEERLGITDKEFAKMQKIVYREFGINLTERKRSLVIGRLRKVIVSRGMTSFSQYIDFLEDADADAIQELANRISTNHTFFYRERDHFDYFTQVTLPEIKARHERENNRDVRVWCAAASSGEEPYTLVITMMEFFKHEYSNWDIGLLATDISDDALTKAKEGLYPDERIKHVPKNILSKYFIQKPGGMYQVSNKLKKEITYGKFNLMNTQMPFRKKFDTIFCRNVLIYFDHKTRIELAKRMYNVLAPGGYLFIGHSETLGRSETPFKYIKPAVYKKE